MVGITRLMERRGEGWQEKCLEYKLIQRKREIKTPEDLMLLSLFHLVNGCSLTEISVAGKALKIGDFSDVAFMKKFAKCTPLFQWISANVAENMVADYRKPDFLEDYRAIAVDTSDVREKGRSGRLYHIHYGIDIFKMSSVCHKITDQSIGEKMSNFPLQKGDLAIGDRIYGTIKGMEYCLENEADFIVRMRTNAFKLYDENNQVIDVFSQLDNLEYEESAEIQGFVHAESGKIIPIRLCAKRKTKEQCEKSMKKIEFTARRKQTKLSENSRKFNEYIVVATSLPNHVFCEDILETYRYRWQIECFFKRLKSIMDFGELHKKNEESSLAWLNGKIMAALLIEIILTEASFFPNPTAKSYA